MSSCGNYSTGENMYLEIHFIDDPQRRLWEVSVRLSAPPGVGSIVQLGRDFGETIKVHVSDVTLLDWNTDAGHVRFRGPGFVFSDKKMTEQRIQELASALGGKQIPWE